MFHAFPIARSFSEEGARNFSKTSGLFRGKSPEFSRLADGFSTEKDFGIFPSPRGARNFSKSQGIRDDSLRLQLLYKAETWNFSQSHGLYMEKDL